LKRERKRDERRETNLAVVPSSNTIDLHARPERSSRRATLGRVLQKRGMKREKEGEADRDDEDRGVSPKHHHQYKDKASKNRISIVESDSSLLKLSNVWYRRWSIWKN